MLLMPMYDLIEDSHPYSKTSGILYQFCRCEPNNVVAESFKVKSKLLIIQVL